MPVGHRHWSQLYCAVALMLALVFAAPSHSALVLDLENTPATNESLQAALDELNRGDPVRAERLAREVITLLPDSPAAHEILGTALALQERLPEAIEALGRAVELSPAQGTALTKLGDIALALDQEAIARDYFERAVTAMPNERRAHQRLGLIYQRQGDLQKAMERFEAGIIGTPAEYLGVKLDLAGLYVVTGQAARALELLDPWNVERTAATADSLRMLGNAHRSLGNLPDALRHYQRASVLAPDDAALQVEFGDVLREAGDFDAAERAYSSAATTANAPVEAFVRHGDLLTAQARFDEAETLYRAAVSRQPDSGAAHHALGSFLGLTRRYEEAVAVYADGLKLSPDSPALLRGIATAELRLARVDSALEHARTLTRIAPDAPNLFLLASLLEQNSALAEAESVYAEALTVDESYWPAHNNLAMVRIHLDRPTEAIAPAERARALTDDQIASVLHTLGLAQLLGGKVSDAAATLERARELEPDYLNARLRLGMAYQALNRVQEARSEFEHVIALDSSSSQAQEARQALEAP